MRIKTFERAHHYYFGGVLFVWLSFPAILVLLAGKNFRQERTVLAEAGPEDAAQRAGPASAQNDSHRQRIGANGGRDVQQ